MKPVLDRFGKVVTSSQGIANALRKRYKTAEEAYHDLSEEPVRTKCECGNDLHFLSFREGYRKKCKSCNIEDGIHAMQDTSNRQFDIEDFMDFYLKNQDLYSRFDNKIHYQIEPFTNRNTGRFGIFGYIQKYFGPKYFPDTKICCIVCNQEQNISFFENSFICGSHKCRNLHNTIPQQQLRELKNKEKFDSRDKSFDHTCQITGKNFNTRHSSYDFITHLDQLPIHFIEYMWLFEPESLRFCDDCGFIVAPPRYNPKNLYDENSSNTIFCCHSHYVNYKIKYPDKIQVYTEAQKVKQSATMKRKIFEGSFTPKRNHWTNWNTKLDGVSYRSRWEAAFHSDNLHLKYEYVRVPYIGTDGKNHTYIIDFFDEEAGICYEVKPTSELQNAKVLLKTEAAKKYCHENGFIFSFVNEDDILRLLQKQPTLEPMLCDLKQQLLKTSKRLK